MSSCSLVSNFSLVNFSLNIFFFISIENSHSFMVELCLCISLCLFSTSVRVVFETQHDIKLYLSGNFLYAQYIILVTKDVKVIDFLVLLFLLPTNNNSCLNFFS